MLRTVLPRRFVRWSCALALTLLAAGTQAATITVTGTGDSIAADGFVTLREALIAANTNAPSGDAAAGSAGLDTINFNISGLPGTVHTISPASGLPTLTEPVVINGYSQLGASPNTVALGSNAFLAIEINGTNAGFNAGFSIQAGGSTVQGLVINRFKNEGILIYGGGNNVIRGNFLGSDATGKLDRGNGIAGVTLVSSNNRVGGTAPSDRNLISGNDFAGVVIEDAGTVGNRIEGNLIGCDDTGNAALGNNGAGVRVLNVSGNSIGGVAAGAGNIIAFNAGDGVQLAASAGPGNLVRGNRVFSNGGLGIDIEPDGVNINDANDADNGVNGLQNYPVLAPASANAGVMTVSFTLDAPVASVGQMMSVTFHSSAACDPSGNGEGAQVIGNVDLMLEADEAYQVQVTGTPASGHGFITAIATDASNNSSEFSDCQFVTLGGDVFANGFE